MTGDARLRLGDSADGRYGMLVVDAFSSSAIPVHLAPEEREAGKDPSQWVVLAHTRSGLGALADDPRWLALTARAGARVWTDDFSNPCASSGWNRGPRARPRGLGDDAGPPGRRPARPYM